ncbi:MAG: endolytic transglycosylase MltG, partial [candidate division Zixibacteria bacterium]|nr:endolytic transglycosylase MltG [candidate division Zixibacteria bacterium]
AGQYQLETGQSVFSVLERLSQGGATAINVAIPPGLTVRQIGKIYEEKIGVNASRLEDLCGDEKFIQSLGLDLKHLEGYLFPETYNFYWKTSEELVIKTMLAELTSMVKNDSLLEPTGKNQDEFYRMLILASMIEKEGLAKVEYPLISAVFHNRLRINMPLQCDPTILYVLPDLNRPIRPKDLQLDSPYNTYKYYGLPPGPICNPGRNAILAAFGPADVKYLYFVHKGDGTHIFSRSLQEHNRAIWQIRKSKTAM